MSVVSLDTGRLDAMLERIETRARAAWADEVLAVAFLPDGRRAVSGGKDNIIRLWGIPK